MVFSFHSSPSEETGKQATKTMLSELQLPEEDSCGMIDCQVENKMGISVDVNSNSRCICPRKRKEHDDVQEHDFKFSKSSNVNNNPVSIFMKKWTESPLTQENIVKETLKEQNSSQNEQLGTWSWIQRQRHDSSKENELEPMHQEDPVDKVYTIKGRFTICENEYMTLSEKHLESNYNLSERRSSSKSSPKRSRSKQISKKLSILKMKIEACEGDFQIRMGYRPSHADKMKDEELSNLINEQTKLKQELKNIKESSEDTPRKGHKSVEQERDQIIESLHNIRLRCGRPFELNEMTLDQVLDEKLDMQSQLVEFEKAFGHPVNKGAKEIMTDLYERYRQVKRQCRRSSSELVPIPEEESIALTLASPKRRMSADLSTSNTEIQDDEKVKPNLSKRLAFEIEQNKEELTADDENWHTMTFEELSNNLKRLREDKKTFKRSINEFEEKFQATTGRKVLREDKEPLENTYLMYRVTKSKIKLIKALIEKHGK